MDLGVNHLGHFLLTNLLLEPLKAAEQGRVVVVASGAYKVGAMYYEDPTLSKGFNVAKAYGRSKLANILFTRELPPVYKERELR
jgi:retinol dehydrogenase-14